MIVVWNRQVAAGCNSVVLRIRARAIRCVIDNNSAILDDDDNGKHGYQLPQIKMFHL